MIVVMLDDLGLIVLDTTGLEPGAEAPVVSWTPDGRLERLGTDFGSYALGLARSAVQ